MEQKPERKSYEWQVFCPVCKASNCNNNITCIKCDAPLEPTNKPEVMNLRQAKDEIALKYGYENWLQFEKECPGHMSMQNFMDEAADLYARSKCREQREICSGDPNDFERDLYDLVKRHINAGLKRPDLIHKLEYVTQSCRVS